jgi:hypothetical protein
LRVEGLVIERVEAAFREAPARPVGNHDSQWCRSPGDEARDRQRCQIADVIGVVMSEENRVQSRQVEPRLDGSLRYAASAVDQ